MRVIDDDKPELPDIMQTYTDTWGKLVKVLKFKKFKNIFNENCIYTLEPEFENLEYAYITPPEKEENEDTKNDLIISEEYHLVFPNKAR